MTESASSPPRGFTPPEKGTAIGSAERTKPFAALSEHDTTDDDQL